MNIEFEYNGRYVFGHFKQKTIETKNINIIQNYDKAYCEALDVYCPSMLAIKSYWLHKCHIQFKYVQSNGTRIIGSKHVGDCAEIWNVPVEVVASQINVIININTNNVDVYNNDMAGGTSQYKT